MWYHIEIYICETNLSKNIYFSLFATNNIYIYIYIYIYRFIYRVFFLTFRAKKMCRKKTFSFRFNDCAYYNNMQMQFYPGA